MPYKGPVATVIHQLVGGSEGGDGLYRTAARSPTVQQGAEFFRITGAGTARESHVHDITVTRESPNYRRASSRDPMPRSMNTPSGAPDARRP